MKKKILVAAIAGIVAAGAAWNVIGQGDSDHLSDVSLANIEALAEETTPIKGVCCKSIVTAYGQQTRFCGSCTYVENSAPSSYSEKGTCQ